MSYEIIRLTDRPVMKERAAQAGNGFHRGVLAFYAAILGLCRRLPVPTVQRQWLYAVILMCCQGGITFTGAMVRVTGSGLGCPTWPQCQPGSLVPESGSAPALHQAIEFGNRMLTFVVSLAAILAFLAVLRAARRSSILHNAFLQGIGIIVQAVLGGITVHMDLAWWMVMAHFLPSMLLTFFAAVMVVKVREPDGAPRRTGMPTALRWATWISTISLMVVLVTGTMTTSSGPHAGDEAIKESDRLQISLIEMANLHAHAMYLYLGVTIGLLAGLFAVRADRRILKASGLLIVGIGRRGHPPVQHGRAPLDRATARHRLRDPHRRHRPAVVDALPARRGHPGPRLRQLGCRVRHAAPGCGRRSGRRPLGVLPGEVVNTTSGMT